MEDSVAVFFWAGLFAAVCAGEVELPAKTAVVAALGQQGSYEGSAFAPFFVTVHAAAHVGGIAAGEETGPAWRADGALAEGVGKGDALLDEAIQIGGVDMGVAQCVNCVKPLLVGAEPENVGTLLLHHRTSIVRIILHIDAAVSAGMGKRELRPSFQGERLVESCLSLSQEERRRPATNTLSFQFCLRLRQLGKRATLLALSGRNQVDCAVGVASEIEISFFIFSDATDWDGGIQYYFVQPFLLNRLI